MMPFIAIPDKYFNELALPVLLEPRLSLAQSIYLPEWSVNPLLLSVPVGLAVVVVHIVLRPACGQMLTVATAFHDLKTSFYPQFSSLAKYFQ